MSAFRRYAVTAALAGLTILAACGTTPASQPGAARSPGPATSTQAPPATTPAPATATPAPSSTPKAPQQPVLRLDSRGSAVLTLQQGLGRLIRHRRDRGVLAVLDPRLRTMGYGRRFLTSLPPAPVTSDLDAIQRFFQEDTRSPRAT